MRTPNINSLTYTPAAVPGDLSLLQVFLGSELPQIAAVIAMLSAGHIEQTYAAPTKPRDGDLRLADGTSWNPGSGQGLYAYYGSAWHSLASSGLRLTLKTSAPASPVEGDIALADGAGWNPGGGKGVYCYYSAAWHFLG